MVHDAGWRIPVDRRVADRGAAQPGSVGADPLISIRAPGTKLLSMIELPAKQHLELPFGDVTDPDEPDAARIEAIEQTFAFVDGLPGPNPHVTALRDTALGRKGRLAKQALRFPAWKPTKS